MPESQNITCEGDTMEQALQAACDLLGCPREEIEYTLDRDHFRSGAASVRLQVRRKDPGTQTALRFGRGFVGGLLQRAGIEGQVRASLVDDKLHIGIVAQRDGSLLIGRDGRTLEALQHLTIRAAQHAGIEARVTVDVEDYRERREEGLKELAQDAAHEARRFRKTLTLRPLNSYERHIIHLEVSKVPGVGSRSVGEGSYKRIQVFSLDAVSDGAGDAE